MDLRLRSTAWMDLCYAHSTDGPVQPNGMRWIPTSRWKLAPPMEERGRRDFDFCHCFHVAGIDYQLDLCRWTECLESRVVKRHSSCNWEEAEPQCIFTKVKIITYYVNVLSYVGGGLNDNSVILCNYGWFTIFSGCLNCDRPSCQKR